MRSSSRCRPTPRAQRIHVFLAEESPAELAARIARTPPGAAQKALEAKLDALNRLQQRLDRLLGEMDHVVTTLQTVQAEILAERRAIEQGALAGRSRSCASRSS